MQFVVCMACMYIAIVVTVCHWDKFIVFTISASIHAHTITIGIQLLFSFHCSLSNLSIC